MRISQDREGSELGVKRQREDCEALAKREGLPARQVYVDNHKSAFSGKPRPDYLAMLSDIREGRVDSVIVWHTDRLHRSSLELAEYMKVCRDRDVPTFTVRAGQLDLSTPGGRMQATIVGAIAAHRSATVAAGPRTPTRP